MDVLNALLAALLPAPEREPFHRHTTVDVVAVSAILGLVEALGGGVYVVHDGLRYVQEASSALAGEMVDKTGSFENNLALTWGGAVLALTWLIRPWTWVLLTIPATGVARLAAWGTVEEPVGEPSLWLLTRLVRLVRGGSKTATHRTRFGSARRPDRVERDGDDALVVLAPRRKDDWTEAATIEVDGRFYHLEHVEEVQDGHTWWYAHHLREDDPSAVIRRLVRYEPPSTR